MRDAEPMALPNLDARRQRRWHAAAVAGTGGLIVLCLAWELFLAPLRPGGSWLAIKCLPLLLPLAGIVRARLYTMQWAAMLVLIYLAEGVVRAMSDTGRSATLGLIEVALAIVSFAGLVGYVRPYKRHHKQQKTTS